jgi:threonine dehydratase
MSAVSLQSVEEAAEAIKKSVHTTPILTCGQLDDLTGHTLFFKVNKLYETLG